MMDQLKKINLIALAWKNTNKFEIINFLKNTTPNELKDCFNYYAILLEIIKLYKEGASITQLKQKLSNAGYDPDDTQLIFKEKNKNKEKVGIILALFFVISAIVLILAISQNFGAVNFPDFFDFTKVNLFGNETIISGTIFGDSTNFSDILITTTNATLLETKKGENNFELKVNCKEDFVINFSKKGFLPLHKKINSCNPIEIDVIMKKMSEFKELNLNGENSVSNKGVKLDVNGGDLVIIGTTNTPKQANLSVTGFNPNTIGDMQYFPGELEGIDENGVTTGLESYGFAKIIAQDEEGNNLDFKEGKSSKVSFKIDPAQQAEAPNEMPLWYFDETKGTWIQEGTAKKVCKNGSCEYIGEITKVRSWWNADKRILSIEKSINNWVMKKDCKEKLDNLKNSNFYKKLKEYEQQIVDSGKTLNLIAEARGLIEPYGQYIYSWASAPYGGLVEQYPQYEDIGFWESTNVDLGEGKIIDMGHAIYGLLSPYGGAQFIVDGITAFFPVLQGLPVNWGQINIPDIRGNLMAQNFSNNLGLYILLNGGLNNSSITDFLDWRFSCDPKLMKAFTQQKAKFSGLFTFSNKEFEFLPAIGINLNDGGLFIPIIDNVYLSTTQNFNNSYSNPKLITFVPFAYANGNKLILVTSAGEIDLNKNISENEFSLNYPTGNDIYKKVGDKFLLGKAELFNNFNTNSKTFLYHYEGSILTKIATGDLEKLFIYNNENLVKIIYNNKNNPFFEYNFFYNKNNKLSSISIKDNNNSMIWKKFNWINNKLEINYINNQQLNVVFDDTGKVKAIGNTFFDYNSDGTFANTYFDSLLSKNNKFEFVLSGQNLSKIPVKFEDIGKKITLSTLSNDLTNKQVYLTINNVPSEKQLFSQIPETGAIFGGYKLNNCSFWEGYPLDFADCIIGWDSLNGLSSKEAYDYVSKLNLSSKDKGIIYSKLADYYLDLDFCYNIFDNDLYSGISCIKQVDDYKVLYPNQNIEPIIKAHLNDSELSFVLRNLAFYYSDTNYCTPIPIEDLRNACFERTPAETELDTNTIEEIVEDMKKINLIDCKFDEKYSSPLKDNEGNYWIKEINNDKVYSNKIAGNIDKCNGSTQMKSDSNGNITPCLSITTKSDGCILSTQKVYSLNSSKENYTIQNKYEEIYKQNEVDFIDFNKNIWFAIDEDGYPAYLKLNEEGKFILKQDIFDKEDKTNLFIPKMFKIKPSKDVYWIILETPLHSVTTKIDNYMRVNVCENAPFRKVGGTGDGIGGFSWRNWGTNFGYGTSIIAKNYNGSTITKIKSKTFCESQVEHIPFSGGQYEGYARIVGTNFNPKENYFNSDQYNTLLVLTNKELLEYYKDSNDLEVPSAWQIIN